MDAIYHKDLIRTLSKERSDAMRGIVEYYSPPSMIADALQQSGFEIDEIRQTTNGPFVNILAIKP